MQDTHNPLPISLYSGYKVRAIFNSYVEGINKSKDEYVNKEYGSIFREYYECSKKDSYNLFKGRGYTEEELSFIKNIAQSRWREVKEHFHFNYPGPTIVFNALKDAGIELREYKIKLGNIISYEIGSSIEAEYNYIESKQREVIEAKNSYMYPSYRFVSRRPIVIAIEATNKFKPNEELNFAGFDYNPELLCKWLNQLSGRHSGRTELEREEFQEDITKELANYFLLKIKNVFFVDRLEYLNPFITDSKQESYNKPYIATNNNFKNSLLEDSSVRLLQPKVEDTNILKSTYLNAENENSIILNDFISAESMISLTIHSEFFTIIKDYFEPKDHHKLKDLLRTGYNLKEPIVFKGNGNKLTNAFKQLIESNYIISCNKKNLQDWIGLNFKYTYRDTLKDFKEDYLEKVISREGHPCKNPVIEIADGKVQLLTNKKKLK